MSPRLSAILIAIAACVLAVWVGASVASEEFFLALVTALLGLWAVLSWTTEPRTESWLVGFLIAGYVLGNRGFAQLTPAGGLPLFYGELGLVVACPLIALRGALRRELPLRPDWLSGLLLLWLGLGAGRMLWDIRVHGLTAVRDFAMVYYLVYFFIVQTLVVHAPSRRVLHGAVAIALGLLPFTAALAETFGDFFRTHFTLGSVPLIFYKDDLLATFLFAGFVYFVPKRRLAPVADWGRWLLALMALLLGFMQLSRAAMVGLAVALFGLVLARLWQPVRALAVAGVAALLLTSVYSLLQREDFTQTKLYGIYEHLAAIGDFSGTRKYANADSADSGDNNRFRIVWWQTVATETLTQAPVFGLGFGHDLARSFVLAYNPLMDDFTARSPHSILFTTLGRMGLVGLAAFLLFAGCLARSSWRAARQVARGETDDEQSVTLHAICWLIFTSACFGVVLEGPMGAIPFWIILGLAHHAATPEPAEEST